MISIIVPVYNVEKYIEICIRSLINQTYTDIQIILVDDGSQDRSGEICDKFAASDNRIIVIHKKNGGLSSARNAGIDIATGEYITFVDSDDYVSEQLYEHMITCLKQTNCDICMCGNIEMTENGNILHQDCFKVEKILSIEEILNIIVLPLKTAVWNKVFKREAIGLGRFPEGRIHGEDLLFLMNILTKDSKCVIVPYIGYYYIKHDNTITTGGFKESAVDEVWCKDQSHIIMCHKFPEYQEQSLVWCFRARMNLIRNLLLHLNDHWLETYSQYKIWLQENYKTVVHSLDKKTILEYHLFKWVPFLYKQILLIKK